MLADGQADDGRTQDNQPLNNDKTAFRIDGKTFWANVKMHKHYHGEVLYTIEKSKPKNLIEGNPQK